LPIVTTFEILHFQATRPLAVSYCIPIIWGTGLGSLIGLAVHYRWRRYRTYAMYAVGSVYMAGVLYSSTLPKLATPNVVPTAGVGFLILYLAIAFPIVDAE